MTPPTVPGEVWRGIVADVCGIDSPILCAVSGTHPRTVRTWTADGDAWVETATYAQGERDDIVVAWALSLHAALTPMSCGHLPREMHPQGNYCDGCHVREEGDRAAERMREACANAAARVDIGTGPDRAVRAIQSRAITAALRVLPIPSPTSPLLAAVHAWADALAGKRYRDAAQALDLAYGLTRPGRALHTNTRGMVEPVCSCPDRIAAGTPLLAHDGRWYMLAHVERALLATRDAFTATDQDGNDYAVNLEVRGCPWCARPLPDGVAERARMEAEREPASLHVPGCARVETEGAGHPGACKEPTAANDREAKI